MEISDREFHRLVDYMHDNFGINLSSKRVLIQGRLGNMLRERGFTSYDQYLDAVMADTSGAEVTTILNKLTTNHTFFMREPEHYTYLKEVILPWAVANAKNHELRIWSAGCSSGEEPYTISMYLKEFFGSQASCWDTRVLATDISQQILNTAQNPTYQEESLGRVPESWKQKYFVKTGGGSYCIAPAIKQNVIFRTFNLMEPIRFRRPFDLIFCRNVMIYFDQPTKVDLVRRFYNATVPGGYLFIGHSESLNKTECPYHYLMPAIYRKVR